MSACPSCGGPRLTRHPAGLVHQHRLECDLLAAEDSTRAADHDRARASWRFTRATTAAERVLLAAAGHELPAGAVTTVDVFVPAVLRRSWAGIDLDAPPPAVAPAAPATTTGRTTP